jgi:hypothetical protein
MNKPEFPKAQLIREDFLPEQDPLENYRIKKVTKGDGTVWYCPQKKVLWFWWNMVDAYPKPYGSECWANAVIREDFKDSQKDKVEYIEPNLNYPEPKHLSNLKRPLDEPAH